MENRYRPASGIRKLLCGTQPILSLSALRAALDVFDSTDLAQLRAKSLALTRLFMDLVEPLAAAFGTRIITPRTDASRGSHVAVTHEHAYPIVQALIARGVIGDFRTPDIMRFGFTPLYLRYRDVFDAAAALGDVLRTQAWRDPVFSTRAAVT